MKKIILIISLCIFYCGYSQNNLDYKKAGDTIYYDKKYRHTLKNTATYFVVIKNIINQKKGKKLFALDIYFKDSLDNFKPKLKSTTNSKYLESIGGNGLTTNYYKNSNIKSKGLKKNGRLLGKWEYWYKNGNKKAERIYEDSKALKKAKPSKLVNYWDKDGNQTVTNGNGFFSYYYEKDSTTHKGEVIDGKNHGIWTGTYSNNKTYYIEKFKKGKMISGESWDKEGINYTYKKSFTKPKYNGGMNGIRNFISKNFNFPKSAIQNRIDGTILINFTVNKEGKLIDIKLTRKVFPPSDKEALRMVNLMSGWKPATYKGQNIEVRYTLPITYIVE